MRAICVDDERIIMEDTVSRCLELPQIDEAKGFIRAADALLWLEDNDADLALLDIDMPGMNGIELAVAIKKKRPDTAIIFLTGYSEYAVEAFAVRATGYLMKPVTGKRLADEVEYVCSRKRSPLPATERKKQIVMRTFGNFDCIVDGETISFRQTRCKELLAYLVDRRGGSVSRAEAFAILWEDRQYDRPMQKQLDAIIRSLRATLQEHGAAEILEIKSGNLRIRPELIECDLYRFCRGDADALNSYWGEYMNGYAWAELTEGYMTRKAEGVR